MNVYELSRNYWDYAFENTDKIKPIHTAIYFFAIEHCNRLGWKESFGFPSSMVMEAIGVKSYKTYIAALIELNEFGLIDLIKQSSNQYTSNIIALVKNTKAHTKAHTKALTKAMSKHEPKQVQSNVSIDKHNNLNNFKSNNLKQEKEEKEIFSSKEKSENLPKPKKQKIPPLDEFMNYYHSELHFNFPNLAFAVQAKYESWIDNGWRNGYNKPIINWKSALKNTIQHLKPINHGNNATNSAFRKPNADELYEQTRQRLRNASFDDSDPWDGTHGYTNTPQADSFEDVQHIEVD